MKNAQLTVALILSFVSKLAYSTPSIRLGLVPTMDKNVLSYHMGIE